MRKTAATFLATAVLTGAAAAEDPALFWTTGGHLRPAWGFYPNGSAYGGLKPLSPGGCAWGSGTLTWVADFPTTAVYHAWVRRYGGYGHGRVSIDEVPLGNGKGGQHGARYVWRHVGSTNVAAGRHHVDIDASGMFDAIVFAQSPEFDPAKDELPEPVDEPVLRALREYRDDAFLEPAAGKHGLVAGAVTRYEEVLYDWLPDAAALTNGLSLWGCANQYVNATFGVRFLAEFKRLRVSMQNVDGPGGFTIGADDIDVRMVHVRERMNCLFKGTRKMLVPELLVRSDVRGRGTPSGAQQGGYGGGECRFRAPAHSARQVWLTVRIPPDAAAGAYTGELVLQDEASKRPPFTVHVSIEVLPLELKPAEGYFGIYYPMRPLRPGLVNYTPPECYLACLKDMARHGLNAVTLYGGFDTLSYAKEAGLMKAPCLMHWPGGGAPKQVERAQAIGFEDLYYYGVDEPHGESIERCRKEAERRLERGVHMMTAINSHPAYEALWDVVDRPVYNLYTWSGPDVMKDVKAKGFKPVSYWVTATAFPLWYRAFTGLYNRRCGYEGTSPWSYQDMPDNRLFNADKISHRVAYPDADGMPIPTLGWEAYRSGIDDVRYVEALERAIRRAEAVGEGDTPLALKEALQRAREVREERYLGIKGRWLDYLKVIRPGDLDSVRRDFADATLALVAAMVTVE